METANGKRVVVVGATGNIGTSLVSALETDPEVSEIVALSRRAPDVAIGRKTTWREADVRHDDLVSHFRGADCVVHLAWIFQPSRDPITTWRNNVLGSLRVFDSVTAAGCPALVYASSVGAYSPGPERRVDETWPTHGWPAAAYSREKAYLERCLDSFEREHPDLRVVRMRTAFSFKSESASEQRRLFAGPFVPDKLVRPELIPALPALRGLRFQAVHSDDLGEAYRLAVHSTASGAFNVAAEPVVDAEVLGTMFHARPLRIPVWPVRAALAAAWKVHAVPASPELFDAFLRLPIMDVTRARKELGWTARHSAVNAIDAFVGGLREHAGAPTPPLRPRIPGGRLAEVATGMGRRQ